MSDIHLQLFEATPDGVVVVDGAGRLALVNARAETMLATVPGR
jgi:PAS domain-containing protein